MARRKIQWHPLLGRLLRHRVEGYYELLTNVPVGDLPRQADIVLLRRTAASPGPFQGLWRYLTPWNVLEYKGPTVTPRREHLPLLVEVGLGIARRLNEQGRQEGLPPMPAEEVSFWYVANRLGRTFLRAATDRLGRLDLLSDGIWRSTVLGHPCYLISGADLPVDEDSLPLHVLGVEPLEQQLAVGQFLTEKVDRIETYGVPFATLHPVAWEEVKAMAKSKRGGPEIDLRPVVEWVGGLDKVIEKLGEDEVLEELLARLTPAKRRKLQRRLNAELEEGKKD